MRCEYDALVLLTACFRSDHDSGRLRRRRARVAVRVALRPSILYDRSGISLHSNSLLSLCTVGALVAVHTSERTSGLVCTVFAPCVAEMFVFGHLALMIVLLLIIVRFSSYTYQGKSAAIRYLSLSSQWSPSSIKHMTL